MLVGAFAEVGYRVALHPYMGLWVHGWRGEWEFRLIEMSG